MAGRRGAKAVKFVVGIAGGISLFSGAAIVSQSRENQHRERYFTIPTAFAASLFSSSDKTSSYVNRNGVNNIPFVAWDYDWDR